MTEYITREELNNILQPLPIEKKFIDVHNYNTFAKMLEDEKLDRDFVSSKKYSLCPHCNKEHTVDVNKTYFMYVDNSIRIPYNTMVAIECPHCKKLYLCYCKSQRVADYYRTYYFQIETNNDRFGITFKPIDIEELLNNSGYSLIKSKNIPIGSDAILVCKDEYMHGMIIDFHDEYQDTLIQRGNKEYMYYIVDNFTNQIDSLIGVAKGIGGNSFDYNYIIGFSNEAQPSGYITAEKISHSSMMLRKFIIDIIINTTIIESISKKYQKSILRRQADKLIQQLLLIGSNHYFPQLLHSLLEKFVARIRLEEDYTTRQYKGDIMKYFLYVLGYNPSISLVLE